jgi:ABC-type multidrug transport system permease subunit
MHFESLFSNPSVPFTGFRCGPTITNESLPTSFPVPQLLQGMAVCQGNDWNFTLLEEGLWR